MPLADIAEGRAGGEGSEGGGGSRRSVALRTRRGVERQRKGGRQAARALSSSCGPGSRRVRRRGSCSVTVAATVATAPRHTKPEPGTGKRDGAQARAAAAASRGIGSGPPRGRIKQHLLGSGVVAVGKGRLVPEAAILSVLRGLPPGALLPLEISATPPPSHAPELHSSWRREKALAGLTLGRVRAAAKRGPGWAYAGGERGAGAGLTLCSELTVIHKLCCVLREVNQNLPKFQEQITTRYCFSTLCSFKHKFA
ncbi:uncharacterized protein LOC133377448 [Rhineura floridana]|uniref:uncharacterized protein LOC133377448 n=1 Tax=Rhineura floridana TaxID=261503 RepID=UPI002AC7F818|nr:uncharacterized protein LOC133377448 [Rhineura floridana]